MAVETEKKDWLGWLWKRKSRLGWLGKRKSSLVRLAVETEKQLGLAGCGNRKAAWLGWLGKQKSSLVRLAGKTEKQLGSAGRGNRKTGFDGWGKRKRRIDSVRWENEKQEWLYKPKKCGNGIMESVL